MRNVCRYYVGVVDNKYYTLTCSICTARKLIIERDCFFKQADEKNRAIELGKLKVNRPFLQKVTMVNTHCGRRLAVYADLRVTLFNGI